MYKIQLNNKTIEYKIAIWYKGNDKITSPDHTDKNIQ